MLFLVSGEGPTDIGSHVIGTDGPEFIPGPMVMILDKLIELRADYSLLDASAMEFISERDLADLEPLARRRSPTLPGKRNPKETLYFSKNAQRLAEEAGRRRDAVGRDVIPVLFRDADGTQSAGRGLWRDKLASIERGFLAAGCETGVPMVPKPKSEAWLLCACKDHPYQHCSRLEEESGNDRSPNSLKSQLNEALNGEDSREEICDRIRDGSIDAVQIDMPSFNVFKDRLDEVLSLYFGPAR